MKEPNGQTSVMLIDDNEVDRMMGQRLAERSGFVGHYAGFPSGQAALDHLSEDAAPRYDIILLDQKMPGMDGVSFLQHARDLLHKRLSGTAVVMLTTILSEEDRAHAESFGLVKQFLSKPLSAHTFDGLRAIQP